MTIQCITCDRFSLRGAPLAKSGFGLCALRPRWENYPGLREFECAKHVPAPVDKFSARREWLMKLEEPKQEERSRSSD